MPRQPGPPMDLANIRENGLRSVYANCGTCEHEAVVNVDALPVEVYVPDVAKRRRCTACREEGDGRAVLARAGLAGGAEDLTYAVLLLGTENAAPNLLFPRRLLERLLGPQDALPVAGVAHKPCRARAGFRLPPKRLW